MPSQSKSRLIDLVDMFLYVDLLERVHTISGAPSNCDDDVTVFERLQSFLEGLKATLSASRDFEDGHYKSTPERGLRAYGRVYAGWAYGQTEWEESFVTQWDANDLLTLLETWKSGDVSLVRDGGHLEKTLASIKARGLIMPCKTDLYFPPEDSEFEVFHCKGSARLVVIDSFWGHMVGGGANPEDDEFIRQVVTKFMEED
ncbi:hypothetical protein C0995_004033 [Termitomyces sp. Mi166|nr:hypothetical protein C0995_004033 [Termitomyces sp. Mi166\